ncbi:ATP-binding protein [Streptomyces sp. Z26]|uniref:AAA family ATPase n=1 Tax=Streptomyces sp. Z26 TaxID=2500177 RepID=UPI000F1E42E2|nr:ATP-binding protein [Streptomyces sp. Z26]RLL69021.1 DUF2813 domain-containing protein [Streptomyces sp. Z26]
MITRIEIDGFKSFLGFELDVHPCTVLVGANGAGKSNLLAALDLVRQTVATGFPVTPGRDAPLAPRHLFHRADGRSSAVMSIKVGMIVPSADGPLPMVVWLEVERAEAPRSPGAAPALRGSVWVSSMERTGWMRRLGLPDELRTALAEARESFVRRTGTEWVPLDGTQAPTAGRGRPGDGELLQLLHRECETWQPVTLDPAAMRRASGGSELAPLLADGGNLAAVLHRLGTEPEPGLEADLAALVPEATGVRALFDDRRGEYDFDVRVRHQGWTSPPMLAGGTLRVLALLAAWRDDTRAGLLAVEELENGLHPTTLAALVRLLRSGVDDWADMPARAAHVSGFRQLLATTHSPALLSALRHDTTGNLVFLEQAPPPGHGPGADTGDGADAPSGPTVTRAHPLRDRRPGEDPGETVSSEQVRQLLERMGQTVV